EDLFCVIFTSGSTGVPKGVCVEHRQLINYLGGLNDLLGVERCSFASVSTFASDLGNTAIFGALCLGGCLYLPATERLMDAEKLASFFDRHSVDCLKIVPSHLQALLEHRPDGRLLPRKTLILGGESVSSRLIERVASLRPDCRIVNHFGPTECTIG